MFGGAFDPPHLAHVALAELAVRQLALDELRIFPTGHAWHKTRVLTGAAHRVAMAEMAFGDLPNVRVDGRETLRSGSTYTVDTLAELHREHPGAELFLVIGEDQAAAFTTWHDWERILALATLAVAGRSGSTPAALPSAARSVRLPMPDMPISATGIRERIAAGQGIRELVPPRVASYIDQHHLYRKIG